VTWPRDAKGTIRIEIPELTAEDRELVRMTLYVDEPGRTPRALAINLKPGGTIKLAERWAGVRVRVAPFSSLGGGGEAALWRKYPGGLHLRLIAVAEG
jgi:hypothetical protein